MIIIRTLKINKEKYREMRKNLSRIDSKTARRQIDSQSFNEKRHLFYRQKINVKNVPRGGNLRTPDLKAIIKILGLICTKVRPLFSWLLTA